jgi:peptide/nickel transport system substrate-binding protein
LVGTGNAFADAPELATKWTGTPDGLHWTIDLRHGARWSDGQPFTSKDVVFTWNALLDPATGYLYRGQFDYVKSVRALGPYRVHFDLSATNALFVSTALGSGVEMLPEHLLGRIPHAQLRQTNFGEHPVGTGPYVLERWRHDEELSFVRNPYWWGGRPDIERVVVRVVINDQARIEAMEEGAADVDDGMGAGGYSILRQDHAPVRLLHLHDLFDRFDLLNLKRPGLADRTVRQAMMYGWDRFGIAKQLSRGDGDVATSVTPVGLTRWYDPNVKRYPFDPERARRMLDAAGYRAGSDGVRRKGNVRLAYALTMNGSGSGGSEDFAAEFQADMRAIGIAIAVRQVDYATYVDETQTGQYEMADAGWGGTPDPDEYTLLDSTQMPPAGNNQGFFSDPALDRDVRKGLETIGYAGRRPYYDDMQRRVAVDVPFLFYEFDYYRVALARRVVLPPEDILPDTYLFRNIAHWRLSA